MGARQRLPVGQQDVRAGGVGMPSGGAAMGARQGLPVGRGYVQVCGGFRLYEGVAVGARQRLSVDKGNLLAERGDVGEHKHGGMDTREHQLMVK